MSDAALTRLARGSVASAVLLVAFGAAVMVVYGSGVPENVFMAVFATFYALIVWLVSPQQPRNLAIWALAVGALAGGIYLAGTSGAALLVDDPARLLSIQINDLIPADLPPTAAILLMIAGPAVALSVFVPLTLGLLYFPDGRPPSRRWNWAGAIALAGLIAFAVGFGWGFRPSNTSVPDAPNLLADIGFLVGSGSVLVALIALFVRYRRSDRDARQQIRWVVWGAAVFAPALLGAANLEGTPWAGLSVVGLFVGGAVFITSYGVAVARYRLYDIDLVISRTVTYGALAALLAGVYALVVVGIGSWLGRGDEPDLWLSIGAIAVIAVAFEPVRLRVERRVNRMVYGKRATPHEVLSRLTSELMESHESQDSMTELARLLTEGTGASQAVVWLRIGTKLRPAAGVPSSALDGLTEIATSQLPESDTSVAIAVRHGEEVLGALSITKPRNEPPNEADRRLLEDIAAGAGLMFRNQRLRAELGERARQVTLSRRRLIEAHDSARHRLERDLHDGAQQQVVALKVKLGLAHAIAEQEGFPELAETVSSLAVETQRAVDEMRALAHGLYPPLLEAEGLGAAVAAATRASRIPVEVELGDLGRFSKPFEETAYFIITELIGEGMTAGASRARLQIRKDAEEGISVVVAFDARFERLRSVTLIDRIEAAGGQLERVSSSEGTRVSMHLPERAVEQV